MTFREILLRALKAAIQAFGGMVGAIGLGWAQADLLKAAGPLRGGGRALMAAEKPTNGVPYWQRTKAARLTDVREQLALFCTWLDEGCLPPEAYGVQLEEEMIRHFRPKTLQELQQIVHPIILEWDAKFERIYSSIGPIHWMMLRQLFSDAQPYCGDRDGLATRWRWPLRHLERAEEWSLKRIERIMFGG